MVGLAAEGYASVSEFLENQEYGFGTGVEEFRKQGRYSLERYLEDIEHVQKSPFNDYGPEVGNFIPTMIYDNKEKMYGFYALKVSESGSLVDQYRLFDGICDLEDHCVIRGISPRRWPIPFYKKLPADLLSQRLYDSIRAPC